MGALEWGLAVTLIAMGVIAGALKSIPTAKKREELRRADSGGKSPRKILERIADGNGPTALFPLVFGYLGFLAAIAILLPEVRRWYWDNQQLFWGTQLAILLAAVLFSTKNKTVRALGGATAFVAVVAVSLALSDDGGKTSCELKKTKHGELGECDLTVTNTWSRWIKPYAGPEGSQSDFVKLDPRRFVLVGVRRPDGQVESCQFKGGTVQLAGLGRFVGLRFATYDHPEPTRLLIIIKKGEPSDYGRFPPPECSAVGRRS